MNQMLRQATEEKVAATTAANGPAKLKVKWKSSATYTQVWIDRVRPRNILKM